MRRSFRLQKLCLALATIGSLAGSAAVIAWGLRPVDASRVAAEKSAVPTDKQNNTSVLEKSQPSRDSFAKLVERPLRQPLYDPPPPKPEVKQLPPLSVELLGTIIEDQNSMAIVRSEQGRVEYKHVGDLLGPGDTPATILEITMDAIVLKRADERITLGVKSKELR